MAATEPPARRIGDGTHKVLDAIASGGDVEAVMASIGEDPRFAARRVRIEAEYAPTRVTWTVRDQGRGFAHRTEAEARRLGDTSALHGRGILLMKHYMDDVVWNERGNEVKLVRDMRPRPCDARA